MLVSLAHFPLEQPHPISLNPPSRIIMLLSIYRVLLKSLTEVITLSMIDRLQYPMSSILPALKTSP